jgi:hypothetical protein
VKLCQVGIEHSARVNSVEEELCCEFSKEETESLRILRALPGGH